MLANILTAGTAAVERQASAYVEEWESLSPREQEVAALICLGLTGPQIADTLGISQATVRSHCKHIYVRFGFKRNELRAALKDWNFGSWWDTHQQ